ncbi:Neurotrypsin [Bulinus truncatus]|nr:Neurotrypsin [Bulinus truncatus]
MTGTLPMCRKLRLNYPSNSPAFGRIYLPTISNNRKEYSKAPLSGEWIRLRASDKINSGLVQVYRAGKWGYVCDDSWDIEDGSVACRQMGFTRGAGAVTGLNETLPKTEWGMAEILMDQTECTGNEKALQLCKYNANHDCSLSEVASVLCLPNKGCHDGWVSGYGKCYKFFKDAKNFQNAHNFCAKRNAGLVNIQSKSENHFLSNILKNLKKDIHQWYTAGRKDNQEWKWWKAGNKTSRTVRSIGADTLWFPGWPSENNSLWEPKDDPTYSCLTLSDEFRSPHNIIENVDYFFWKADICENPKGINFICEMGIETQSVNECYNDNGSNYRGFATTTERGTQCLSWEDSKKVNDRTNPGKGLGDHNYCRNPDNDARPWCWTDHGLLNFGFCKLDKCSEDIDYVATSSSSQNLGEALNCPPEEFYCHKQKKCIPKAFHCDKDFDCELGEDEEGCEYALEKFDKTKGVTLLLSNTSSQFIFASYINVTDEKCAKECLASTQYICRSFVYNVRSQKCDLSQYNTQNGSIIESTAYDFYEMISQKNCKGKFRCANNFCVENALRCNGNDDCKDLSDELGCSEDEKIGVALIGEDENFGTVEITYMGEKGIICDDEWSIEDAIVICKMLGYGKAEKATKLNRFNYRLGKTVFMLDDVKCHGNESSIQDCPKSQWKQHDCRSFQIAGVVCQSSKKCTSDQFKCRNGDCLKAMFVCDKTDHCGDNSDELDCVYNEFKLVNGSRPWEGRVEVLRNGLQGTVCDDQWDEKEVAVICMSMGFRYGGEIASQGRFGHGTGPVWLDDLDCSGNESSLNECKHSKWGVSNCEHSEDVGVVCHLRSQRITTFRPTTITTNKPTTPGITQKPSKGSNVTFSLAGGSSSNEGVVVITLNYRKYYICDDNWDDNDATVLCRMLNFSQKGEATHKSKFGDNTSADYLLDDVDCAGSETNILQCYAKYGLNKHDCISGEQAGVICPQSDNIRTTSVPSVDAGKCGYRPYDHKDLLSERERRSIPDFEDDLNAPRTLEKQNNEKIIGGRFAQHGAFPWQVRIEKALSPRFSSHHCGAVIISEYWLLSAAHCFYEWRKTNFKVIVGDHHQKNKDRGEQVFDIDLLINHELYEKDEKDYDIALIKVKPIDGHGVQFNDYVQPACLPDMDTPYTTNLKCDISGWGGTDDAERYPDVLKSAKAPIIDQTSCYRIYRNVYTERMMCAGYLAGGIDTCDGDSGGPLVCNHQGAYTVFGVTSWGRGCAIPNAPGVYSNVKVFLTWIKSEIIKNSNTNSEKFIPPKP